MHPPHAHNGRQCRPCRGFWHFAEDFPGWVAIGIEPSIGGLHCQNTPISQGDSGRLRFLDKGGIVLANPKGKKKFLLWIYPSTQELVKNNYRIFISRKNKKSWHGRRISAICSAGRERSSNDPARNMNGGTDLGRLPFAGICGSINMSVQAAMPLTSSSGISKNPFRRQWSICWEAAAAH